MSIGEFVGMYLLSSLFWKWIISWGGAQWLEGWKSMLFLDWFTWSWNAEQIRLYAVVIWAFTTIFFLVGLFKPEWRF